MQQNLNIKEILVGSVADILSISQQHEESLKHNEDKIVVLDNLKNIDLGSLGSFFEELKKKIDLLQAQAIINYNTSYESIIKKINENSNGLKAASATCATTVQKLNDLLTNIEKNPELGHFIQLDTINEMASNAKKSVRISYVDQEIQKLFGKEEIYSEIGTFSAMFSTLESRLAYFLTEHLSNFVSQEVTVTKRETVDDQIIKLDQMKSPNQILDEAFASCIEENSEYAHLGRKPLLHQIRYSSNEIYTFDLETQEFGSYEFFTESDYKTPFTIFNNSGSCLWKNHLVFIFGGEDPTDKDRTSNRVFCSNLNQKNEKNQLVMKEIPGMLFKRQEFSLAVLNDSIYLISGYDMNLPKERRVISKCERLHLKSRKFYEVRDINYPRQWSSCLSHSNTHLYVFGGQNPKYMGNYVDKVEKYLANLNEFSVLKYTILDDFQYEPVIKMGIFKAGDQEIVLLGGEREGEAVRDYYVFDIKKYMFVKRRPLFLKEDDHFANRNDTAYIDNKAFLFSGCFANRIYKIDVSNKTTYNFELKTQSLFD